MTEAGSPPRRRRARRLWFGIVAVAVGFGAPLAAFELGLRFVDGAMFQFEDMRPLPWGFPQESLFDYDTLLGSVPRPLASFTWRGGWAASTDEYGLRNNGAPQREVDLTGRALMAVGDSGAFGDEVEDHQTWPAQLEQVLGRRVLNAGVSAYGIDQVVLRTERLVPRFRPSLVVLSLVSDDVTRTALSFHFRWRPYFELEGDDLVLNLPPTPEVPLPQSPWMVALGHSHVAKYLANRSAPLMWEQRRRRREHHDEREVSGRLLARLDTFVEAHDAKLLVVFLVGGDGDEHHLPDLLARANAAGVEVLDLSEELGRFARDPAQNSRIFRPHYHLSQEGNAWVVARVVARLHELGWIKRTK